MDNFYQLSDILVRLAVLIQSDSFSKDYGTNEKYTSIEVHTISYIASHPGCKASDIAYSWGKSASAVSQIIKKLKQAELIDTKKEANNLKNQYLYLTEKGIQLDKAHRQFDKGMDEMLYNHLSQHFSKEQLSSMIDILQDYLEFYCNSKSKNQH